MDSQYLKKAVNKIFAKANLSPVKKFAVEFADGILFQTLFNIIYDEQINCKLISSADIDIRMTNWNRINQVICFNYF